MSWSEFPEDSPIRRLLTGYGLVPGGLSDMLAANPAGDLTAAPPADDTLARPEEIAQVMRRESPPTGGRFGGMDRGQWGEFLGGWGDVLTGYPLAERMLQRRERAEQMRRQRIQDELRLQHERRMLEQEQRQSEAADIRGRMALGEAGYRPLEPGEEPQEPIGRYQIGTTGPPVQINKRPVEEYGGRKYAGPSPYERRKQALIAQQMLDAEAGRKSAAKISEAGAIAEAEAKVKAKYAPPPKPTAAERPFLNQTEEGTYLISPAGQVTEAKAPGGKPIKKAKGTTGGEGALAAERVKLARDKARSDELVQLEKREDAVAKQVADLRGIVTDEEADDKVKGAAASRLKFKDSQLKRIRQQKVERGFTTAQDAGLAAATAPAKTAAAPMKTATRAQVEAYATARGISYEEARRRARADGYEVK